MTTPEPETLWFDIGAVVDARRASGPMAWLRRRCRRPEPAGTTAMLGVDRTGIRWRSGDGDTFVPWRDIDGMRIHSVVSGQSAGVERQYLFLDLLARHQPVTGRVETGAGTARLRSLLPEVTGGDTRDAYELAIRIGAAIRHIRPDLWRGYTVDFRRGYVQFQSWDSPEITVATDHLRPKWRFHASGADGI